MRAYWDGIEAGLARIGSEKPQTFAEVKAILDTLPGSEVSSGDAFFGGSGGDLSLSDALRDAGWRYVWSEASYYWCMRSPVSGDILSYVEGDVYQGDSKPEANDDEQDVLYASGPIMTGAAVRASNPGGRTVEGVLQGYYGIPPLAQVLWVDLAFTPARYHEGSFVEVTEI